MHHAERYSEKVCAATHDPPEGQLAIGFASILLFFSGLGQERWVSKHEVSAGECGPALPPFR